MSFRAAIVNTKTNIVEFVFMLDDGVASPPHDLGNNYIAIANNQANVGWLWDGANLSAPPDPALTPAQQRFANFMADPDRADLVNRLTTATPAQIDAFIEAQVTSLATAKPVFKAILKLLALTMKV